MANLRNLLGGVARRDLLRAGLGGLALGATGGVAALPAWAQVAAARSDNPERILVIVELSGGNDGLNSVVPYGDDAYYRERPRLGIRKEKLRRIDDHFGLQFTMSGFERLYKDGELAIVHGVGYDQPSLSHFASMAYWHTAAPNSGEQFGWAGRLADALDPASRDNFIVNVDAHQSLAVRARAHVPLVFDDPEKFARGAFADQKKPLLALSGRTGGANAAERFMLDVARSAVESEERVREAWKNYKTPIDYGLARFGLDRVASLIAADFPTRVFYVAYRNNAFDTHVYQADVHARLWTYASDHITAFVKDMERIGRGGDVVVMAFSEFGRRLKENTSLGTDHGTAGPAFVLGKPVRGGQYGAPPSLVDLDDGNLKHTTDFRRVYATLIRDWMGSSEAAAILKGEYASLGLFGAA